MTEKKGNHGLQGMTFGAMDAIINVLGIVVGLSVIGNKVAVVIGLIVAGLANSFGNAAGFHVSEETEGIHTRKEVWMSTLLSFAGTFSVTIILLLPLLFFPLGMAEYISVSGGIIIMVMLALIVSRLMKYSGKKTLHLVGEYVLMGIAVIIIAYYLGLFASEMLGGMI